MSKSIYYENKNKISNIILNLKKKKNDWLCIGLSLCDKELNGDNWIPNNKIQFKINILYIECFLKKLKGFQKFISEGIPYEVKYDHKSRDFIILKDNKYLYLLILQ